MNTEPFRRFAPKKKQTDKLLILLNVMDEPPPSVLFHPRGSAKGRCGTRNDGVRWSSGRKKQMKQPCVYIMANLPRRAFEHREGLLEGFSKKYGCKRFWSGTNCTRA